MVFGVMELGKAKLRRNGINNLKNALHPDHGLVWTDGKGVFLAPVHLFRDQVEKAGSLRLGEFDNVQSVHWSSVMNDGASFMAVVHQNSVSVWHVSGTVPKLTFKQVRKISVQPIPQGCLWNPESDVLCLLSRQQCSFYFRHIHNRGSFAFPSLEHEMISCGCWTPDGKRLVLCVGTAFLIYTWRDLQVNINEFVASAWKIPGVSGNITAIVSAASNSVVCASDLPLDTLCKSNTDKPGTGVGETNHEVNEISATDSLFNLHLNPENKIQASATLSLVQLRSRSQDPTMVTCTSIPGLISPDILHFQVESKCVVVGSNTLGGLQIYALLDNHLLPAGNLTLDKDQRPKGICGLPASQMTGAYGVLVLLGIAESADPAFLSNCTTPSFTLTLRFVPTRPEKAKQLPNGHAVDKSTSSSLIKSESLQEAKTQSISDSHHVRQSSYNGERPDHRLWSPEQAGFCDSNQKLPLIEMDSTEHSLKLSEDMREGPQNLIEEVDNSGNKISLSKHLETEKVDFTQKTPHFQNSKFAQLYKVDQSSKSVNVHEKSVNSATPTANTSHHSDITSIEKTKDRLINGFSSLGKPVRNFQKSRSLDQTSVDLCETSSPFKEPSDLHPKISGTERDGKQNIDDAGSVCSSHNSSDSNYEVLEKQIQTQRDYIEALKKRLETLTVMVEDSACVFPTRYQKITEPEAVSIQCVVGGARVCRKFLLDNGRLQLNSVKQAFGLLTVELILDGEPIVLGANIDGYIPIRFTPGNVLQVTGIPVTYSQHITQRSEIKEALKT